MIVTDGYFQADGHPGNVLVMKGGVVGLLDYGQAKVLTEPQRLAVGNPNPIPNPTLNLTLTRTLTLG